jgi:hypothetical protein
MAGGDVIKDQLIRPIVLISPGLRDRIPRIHMVKKLHAFDHAAFIHVEAGNDAFGKHGGEEKLPIASCELPVSRRQTEIWPSLATDN